MQTRSEGALLKALGVRSLTASIVNTTIGAGIFVLPAAVAAGLGAAAPLAYILCAALMALIVSCFAAAGSRVSLTGGLYAYVGVAFGPFVGFLAGVLYWLMASFAVASVASAFAGSMGVLWTGAASGLGRAMVLAALFGALAFVNVRGVAAAAPLAEAASRVLGRGGRLLVLIGAVVSMFGYVSGDMLGSPRALFAFARDGIFPAPLVRVHPRFRTPYVAVMVHAAIVATLAI